MQPYLNAYICTNAYLLAQIEDTEERVKQEAARHITESADNALRGLTKPSAEAATVEHESDEETVNKIRCGRLIWFFSLTYGHLYSLYKHRYGLNLHRYVNKVLFVFCILVKYQWYQ